MVMLVIYFGVLLKHSSVLLSSMGGHCTRNYPVLRKHLTFCDANTGFLQNQQVRNTTQIWVVMHHQYKISALASKMSFRRKTGGNIAKCRLFAQV